MNLNYLRSSALNHSASPPPLMLTAVTSSSYQCQVTRWEGQHWETRSQPNTPAIANARDPRGSHTSVCNVLHGFGNLFSFLVTVILKLHGDKKSHSFRTHMEILCCFYVVLNLDMLLPVLTIFHFPSTSREPAAHPEPRQVSNHVFKWRGSHVLTNWQTEGISSAVFYFSSWGNGDYL